MNNSESWTFWPGILHEKHVILFFKEEAILCHSVWENNARLIVPMCYPWRWLWRNYRWWLRKRLKWISFAVPLLRSFHWIYTASMSRGIKEGRHALSFHLAQVELSYFSVTPTGMNQYQGAFQLMLLKCYTFVWHQNLLHYIWTKQNYCSNTLCGR